MEQNTLIWIVIAGVGFLLIQRMGGLGKLLGPRQAQTPPPVPTPMWSQAMQPVLTPVVSPAPAQAQAPAPVVILRESVPAALPQAEGPVHETSVTVPMKIRVIPQPPTESSAQ